MRTIILIFVWLSLSASALSQNLVAYYPFTGNANDQSGNGINPTYIGAGVTLTTDRFGYANNAYNFNGTTNSYMRMPADLLPTTNRTISLWFNVTDVTNRPGLLGYGGNGSCGTTLLMGLNLLGAGQYYVQGHCGNNAAGYAYPAAPLNNWYHWVLTINGSVQKIYVNGQLKSTDNTFGGSTAVSGKDFSLGTITSISGTAPYTDANVDYLNGKLDDVRIYDAAMSDAQVLQLYNNELTGLVAYYPFNGDANDESGNGYNGVVSGAFLTSDRFEQTGKAYNFTFNGTSSDKIQVAGTSGLNFSSGGFSVSGWFRFTGTAGAGNNYPIFSKHNCGEQSGYIVMLYNDKITFWMAGAGGYSYLSTPESYTDGQWHHVAAVYDGATRYIFIDGQQKISDAFAYTVPN
ncbi:MAG: LamG domain-containing protein, partial [Chitinophagaceae bacterium]